MKKKYESTRNIKFNIQTMITLEEFKNFISNEYDIKFKWYNEY